MRVGKVCFGRNDLYRCRGAVDAGAGITVRDRGSSIASCGWDDFSADEAGPAEQFFHLI